MTTDRTLNKKLRNGFPNGRCGKCGYLKTEHGGPYNGIYYACPPFVELRLRERVR